MNYQKSFPFYKTPKETQDLLTHKRRAIPIDGKEIGRLVTPKIKNRKIEVRCAWAADPVHHTYHDTEWGRPVHDDRILFEFLILEGAQAGLSWTTILKKRENYRKLFSQFNPHKIASYDSKKIAQLMKDPGIVRNRLKIESTISNARSFLAVQKEFGSFDKYLWQFVGGKPIKGHRKTIKEVPAQTAESDQMSKDLKRRGFRFVGSTICYALMQACGLVDDHTVDCFRYQK